MGSISFRCGTVSMYPALTSDFSVSAALPPGFVSSSAVIAPLLLAMRSSMYRWAGFRSRILSPIWWAASFFVSVAGQTGACELRLSSFCRYIPSACNHSLSPLVRREFPDFQPSLRYILCDWIGLQASQPVVPGSEFSFECVAALLKSVIVIVVPLGLVQRGMLLTDFRIVA